MIRMMRKDRKPIKPLEQFQKPRRRAFNLITFVCPKCGLPMRAGSSQERFTRYYCTGEECNGSQKVSRG